MSNGLGRMPTGIPGLDRLLEGGIVRGNSLLIEGPPGSGKTTFGVRMIAEGVRQHDEPGLIISFEEFPRQIYEEAWTQGVDLEELEATGKLRIVWTPPQRVLDSFNGRNDLIDDLVKQMGVRRILVDSVTHFKRVSDNETDLREVLAGILSYFKLQGVNSILVKELERNDERDIAFEEYLVDASMRVLNGRRARGGENVRSVEIRKTRGQGHTSGRHPFTLSADGIVVYPRLRPQDVRFGLIETQDARRNRVSTGVPGLDTMLNGGLWEGSVNGVSGYQASGKTVLTYHFLDEQLRAGRTGLFVSFHRSPGQVVADAASLGLDWSGYVDGQQLQLLRADWVGMTPEIFLNRLFEAVASQSPDAFALDSLNDFADLCDDDRRVGDDTVVLVEMLRSVGATSMLLQRLSHMRGDATVHDQELGELLDAQIQFSVAEGDGRLERFVSVRKHSGSNHASDLRELRIDERGMFVADRATSRSGVLTGSSRRGYEDPAQEVLPRIETILATFREVLDQLPDDAPVVERLESARNELVVADVVMREHFGVTEYFKLADRVSADDTD